MTRVATPNPRSRSAVNGGLHRVEPEGYTPRAAVRRVCEVPHARAEGRVGSAGRIGISSLSLSLSLSLSRSLSLARSLSLSLSLSRARIARECPVVPMAAPPPPFPHRVSPVAVPRCGPSEPRLEASGERAPSLAPIARCMPPGLLRRAHPAPRALRAIRSMEPLTSPKNHSPICSPCSRLRTR